MKASEIIFYIISAYIIGTGLMAVTTRRIFRASVWLLLSLVGVASLYFWMDMQFIAAVQIVVYVGGIVVLIIFSVLLTQKAGDEMPKPLLIQTLFGGLGALLGLVFLVYLVLNQPYLPSSNQVINADVAQLGFRLLETGPGGYALPFEVVSLLLLSAMIGCIVIAMKTKKEEI